jgi:hypothetical protein
VPTEEQKDDGQEGSEDRVEHAAGAAERIDGEPGGEGEGDAIVGGAGGDEDDDEDDAPRAAAPRDEDDDEGDAGEAAARVSAADPATTPGTRKAAATAGSAGARLAAAKAAKAAKKAARRAKESADLPPGMTGGGRATVEDPTIALKESAVGQAAARATDWAKTNQALTLGVLGALVLGLVGFLGYRYWQGSKAEAAGVALAAAVEIANAEIVGAGETAPTDETGDDEPTFPTVEERSQAALEAYRRVVTEHGGTDAARWARLGEARALYDLGQLEEARSVYETALDESGRDPLMAWRALEGIGFTYEVGEQWDEAIAKYEELRAISDNQFQSVADYHIARMRIAKGETAEATTALRAIVERLRTESESEEPEFPYVLAQAEIRLRELDPSAASSGDSPMMIGPGGAGGGGMPDGIPPELLEQLRRQMEQQGAGGLPGAGGPPGAPPGSGPPGAGAQP